MNSFFIKWLVNLVNSRGAKVQNIGQGRTVFITQSWALPQQQEMTIAAFGIMFLNFFAPVLLSENFGWYRFPHRGLCKSEKAGNGKMDPTSPADATTMPLAQTISTFRFPNPATTSFLDFSDDEDDEEVDDDGEVSVMQRESETEYADGDGPRSGSPENVFLTGFNPFAPVTVAPPVEAASSPPVAALRFSSLELTAHLAQLELMLARELEAGPASAVGQVRSPPEERRRSSQAFVSQFLQSALRIDDAGGIEAQHNTAKRESVRKSTHSLLQFLLDSRQTVSLASVSPNPSILNVKGSDYVLLNSNRMSTAISFHSSRGANRFSFAVERRSNSTDENDIVSSFNSVHSHTDSGEDIDIEKELAGEYDDLDDASGEYDIDEYISRDPSLSFNQPEDPPEVLIETHEALDTVAPLLDSHQTMLPIRPKRTTSYSPNLRLLTGIRGTVLPMPEQHQSRTEPQYVDPSHARPRINSLKRPSFSEAPPRPHSPSIASPQLSLAFEHQRMMQKSAPSSNISQHTISSPLPPAIIHISPTLGPEIKKKRSDVPPIQPASTLTKTAGLLKSSRVLSPAKLMISPSEYPNAPAQNPLDTTLVAIIVNINRTHFQQAGNKASTVLSDAQLSPLTSIQLAQDLIHAAELWRTRRIDNMKNALYRVHACAVAPWILSLPNEAAGLTRETVHPSAVAMYVLAMCLFEGAGGCRRDGSLGLLVLEMAAGVAVNDGKVAVPLPESAVFKPRPTSMFVDKSGDNSVAAGGRRGLIVPQRRASLKTPHSEEKSGRRPQFEHDGAIKNLIGQYYPLADPAWSLIDSYGQDGASDSIPSPRGPSSSICSGASKRKSQMFTLTPMEFLRLPTLRLAECHELGRGTDKSPQKAAYYYQVWQALGGVWVGDHGDDISRKSFSSDGTSLERGVGSVQSVQNVTDIESFYKGITKGESKNRGLSGLFGKKNSRTSTFF
ncbi:hypothetical protein BC830DRAFT_1086236 [Chytriomyces sp. MP71]|nr:hypothetical protein BC830DRAFT_1086236 [Chytriomyces sp. MP71]